MADVLNSLNNIWKYCTENWLVKIDRTNIRVERCKINNDWFEIQKCYESFKSKELIERDKQLMINAEKLIPNIIGNITSYSAMKNENNINLAFIDLLENSKKYFLKKQTSFEEEVKNKMRLFN